MRWLLSLVLVLLVSTTVVLSLRVQQLQSRAGDWELRMERAERMARSALDAPPPPRQGPVVTDPSRNGNQVRPTVAPDAAPQTPPEKSGQSSDAEQATIAVFEQASRSVVNVNTSQTVTDIFRMRALEVPEGTGSGFVWDKQGHVVTNFHVIRGARGRADGRFRVTLPDQSVYDARLQGASPRNDLAVLQIQAPPDRLIPLALGRSAGLRVGQRSIAIGSPFGLDQTLSVGVVSALGREIDGVGGLPIRDSIQTDAAINPGNSGGPLLDSAGRLIGVNTAIYAPSTGGGAAGSVGIGFAIPVDTVRRVVRDLITHGRVVRAVMGVDLASDRMFREQQGALIMNVRPGSPAAGAGLQPTRRDRLSGRYRLGDMVVRVGDTPIDSKRDLLLALERYRAEERVTLIVIRDGVQVTAQVTLVSELELD